MPELLVIAGPTACGKTDLAVDLSRRLPIEVINADALQVYRGLDIGTAKPSAAVRERVRHHLVDILDPDEPFSAGRFARLARDAADDVRNRGLLPVVVGGSGFYLHALIDGLAEIPAVPSAMKEQIAARIQKQGAEIQWQQLRAIDPEFADSIDPHDRQRINRGLEVYEATGRTLTSWQGGNPSTAAIDACWIGLTVPRALLYDRIEARAERMLNAGWLREVRDLVERYGVDAPSLQAIGYKTLVDVLELRLSRDSAIDEIVRDTRRYAKRQLTWFRRDPRVQWLPPGDIEGVLAIWREAND